MIDFNRILDNSFREIKVDDDYRGIIGDGFSIDYFASVVLGGSDQDLYCLKIFREILF